MTDSLSTALNAIEARLAHSEALRLAFTCACAERVRYLLEDEAVVHCLDTLVAHVQGKTSRTALANAASQAAALANSHQGSRSLDGVGHAAVSASYAVAHALAGRVLQTAEYAAYAAVYGSGGYEAVGDPASFAPEKSWQLAKLQQVAASFGCTEGST